MLYRISPHARRSTVAAGPYYQHAGLGFSCAVIMGYLKSSRPKKGAGLVQNKRDDCQIPETAI